MGSVWGGVHGEALDENALGPSLLPAPGVFTSVATSPADVARPTAPVLIASKLSTPWPVRQTMGRSRLEKVLQAGADRALTLLVAPAGFGKTTLATRWLNTRAGNTPGWVSLEPADNDPVLFWRYVRTALTKAGVAVPTNGAETSLPMGEPSRDRDLVTLVNILAGLEDDVVVVLDDYQLITNRKIHEQLIFLLEKHLPRFHLVILTRTDPPFPLPRWKVKGLVTELRARDLAFTAGETARFLRHRELVLADETRDSLHARTGGWPAALQLAALWVSGQADPAGAVRQFASSDATIADYLVAEVLTQLPDDMRRFLLLTSILPRLTGSLCDAVTGTSNGTSMLEEIERRGLFVQALDRSRNWLRYHQLLIELLRDELRRAHPELVGLLHQRASDWFAGNGFAADAIEQAVLGEHWTAVRGLLLGQALTVGSRYPPSVVEGWLTSIPRRVLQDSPFLLLVHGFVLGNLGRVEQARLTLAQSARAAEAYGEDLELPDLGALRYAMEAAIARLDCDLPAVERFLAATEEELDPTTDQPSTLGRMARAAGGNALAGTLYCHGRFAEAAHLVAGIEAETVAHDLPRMQVNAVSLKALLLADRGQLRRAQVVATEALELADAVGVSMQFQTNPAHLALAVVAWQRGENAVAAKHLTALVDRTFQLGDRGPHLVATVVLARMSALDGDLKSAFGLLERARTAWPGWTPPPALLAMIDAEEVQLCLLSDDDASARAVHALLTNASADIPAVDLAGRMAEARLLLAENRASDSSALFRTAAETALSEGQLSAGVAATVCAAAACRAAGRLDEAVTLLDQALELAHDENIRAPFLAEAEAVRPLLLRMGTEQGFRRREFCENLLTAIGVPPPGPRRAISAHGEAANVLSRQERAVLRMLSGPLSYRQIAASLDISVNTLKTHVRNVHRKLGAENRVEAIARGRALGLI